MRPGAAVRPLAVALVAGSLVLAWPGDAAAQGPCEMGEVRQYVAAIPWPRTAQAPPGSWLGCLSTLQRDDKYKHTVLATFTAVRARKPAAAREPTEDDRRLFAGLQPAIDQKLLRTWQPHLGIGRPEQRFESLAYQAFLGALAYIVLDRGAGLEKYGVEPARILMTAANGRRDWAALEQALLSFRGVPLWPAPGVSGPSLGELRDGAARVPPGAPQIAALVEEIKSETRSDAYWGRIAPRLVKMPALVAAGGSAASAPAGGASAGSAPAGGAPATGVLSTGSTAVRIPAECPAALRRAVESCPPGGEWERCAALRTRLAEELERLRAGLVEKRAALPAAVDYAALQSRLDALGRFVQALASGAPGTTRSAQLEAQLDVVVDAERRVQALGTIVACRGALDNLVRGRAGEARKSLESVLRATRARPPHLVAAYLATRFWQEGNEAVRSACAAGDLACGRGEVARELRLLEPIVRLAPGTIRP